MSYWYKVSEYFNAGFKITNDAGDIVTTQNATVRLQVFNATSIGGTTRELVNRTYSTNYSIYSDSFIGVAMDTTDQSRPYYALFTNESSKTITLRKIIDVG